MDDHGAFQYHTTIAGGLYVLDHLIENEDANCRKFKAHRVHSGEKVVATRWMLPHVLHPTLKARLDCLIHAYKNANVIHASDMFFDEEQDEKFHR